MLTLQRNKPIGKITRFDPETFSTLHSVSLYLRTGSPRR